MRSEVGAKYGKSREVQALGGKEDPARRCGDDCGGRTLGVPSAPGKECLALPRLRDQSFALLDMGRANGRRGKEGGFRGHCDPVTECRPSWIRPTAAPHEHFPSIHLPGGDPASRIVRKSSKAQCYTSPRRRYALANMAAAAPLDRQDSAPGSPDTRKALSASGKSVAWAREKIRTRAHPRVGGSSGAESSGADTDRVKRRRGRPDGVDSLP